MSNCHSINGSKLLTANLIFFPRDFLARSCRDKVSFFPLSGGVCLKKAAVIHFCGVFFFPICLTRNYYTDNLYFGQIVCRMGQLLFCQGVRLLRIENCFARSSPNKRFDVVVVLFPYLVWNSGRKEGFSCSRLKADSSGVTCPTRAMASTLSVSISLVSTLDLQSVKTCRLTRKRSLQ